MTLMTPIHFNEILSGFSDLIGKDRVKKIAAAPFLTLTTLNEPITKADSEAIRLLDERDGLCRCPFPLARYLFRIGSDEMFGFIERKNRIVTFFVLHREGSKFNKVCWLMEFKEGTHPFSNAINCSTRVLNSKTGRDITSSYEKVWTEHKAGTSKKQVEHIDGLIEQANSLNEKEEQLEDFSDWSHDELIAKKAELIAERKVLKGKSREATARIDELKRAAGVLHGASDFIERVIGPNLGVCGQIFEPTRMSDDIKEFLDKALYCLLMIGCYEYLAPYNFMALVQPNKEGKSVEWVKAREHYTIIHRHHPANSEAVTEGASITESESKILERTAHSRRAHTRLLSSPKFRFKQGLRVFVRACWCGPKEWKDEGGKQIYKILVERQGLEIAA